MKIEIETELKKKKKKDNPYTFKEFALWKKTVVDFYIYRKITWESHACKPAR